MVVERGGLCKFLWCRCDGGVYLVELQWYGCRKGRGMGVEGVVVWVW